MEQLPVYDMLTPPSDDSINYSLERLFAIGAIDEQGAITPMGRMINSFRKLPVESCKMILSGIAYGASLKELVCLAALLTLRKSDIVFEQRPPARTYDTALLFDEIYEIASTFDREQCDTANYNRLKARLLVGCEMLEMLLVYQRFTAKAATLAIAELKQWCLDKGFNYTALCKITESIDEIYWGMMDQLHINPVKDAQPSAELYQVLKRSGDIDNTDLVSAVILLKKCIYEGYKANLLVWDAKASAYKTRTGLPVLVPSKIVSRLSYQQLGAPFEQQQPQLLVCKELLTRQDRGGQFATEASVVSVMDGFVHVDVDFMDL